MLLDQITALQRKLDESGVTVSIVKNPVIDDIKWDGLLNGLKMDLPDELKIIFTKEGGGLQFSWFAATEIYGENCTRGFMHLISPEEMINTRAEMLAMVSEAIADRVELEVNKGLQAMVEDWPHWIPLFRFPNGDAFCLDIRNSTIVFLEHDVMDGGPYIG
jgi:cell wall assembly regulator SMI1